MKSEPNNRQEVAMKLKQLRTKAGFTQKEIGEVAGKAPQTVASWENGKGQPDIKTFAYLCYIYGISDIFKEFGYLIEGEMESIPEKLQSSAEKYSVNANSLSDEEKIFLMNLRQLSESERKMAMSIVETILSHKAEQMSKNEKK